MKKYFAPLGIFVMGQLCLLLIYLFFPALGQAGTDLATNVPDASGVIWGWDWITGSVRLIIVVILELVILYGVARAFLAAKD